MPSIVDFLGDGRIDIGSQPDDMMGDSWRVSFYKANNFQVPNILISGVTSVTDKTVFLGKVNAQGIIDEVDINNLRRIKNNDMFLVFHLTNQSTCWGFQNKISVVANDNLHARLATENNLDGNLYLGENGTISTTSTQGSMVIIGKYSASHKILEINIRKHIRG